MGLTRLLRRSKRPAPRRRRTLLDVRELEVRILPSVTPPVGAQVMAPVSLVIQPDHHVSPSFSPGQSPAGYWPAQISQAYGFNKLSLNGTGETIAIVDAYADPNLASDLATFDAQFHLSAPPSFTQVNENGGSAANVPTDPTGDWEVEETLDVEWAHAIAPNANILLVEANSASLSDLMTAVNTARNATGVVAVSMSWGGSEDSSLTSYESYFTTPTGHPGVTFVAASGDNGAPSDFPALSPNVLAVGGTTLTLNGSDNRVQETGWSGSGGGYSSVFSEPSYQQTYAKSTYVQNTLGNTVLLNTMRGAPDVSYDADPSPGYAIYDSFPYEGTPLDWAAVGGTSAAAPQWAALMALVAQDRGAAGSLDGATQTLPDLYQLAANPTSYANDFNDVTSGNNGYSAQAGYDLVTGLGTPKANNLIPDLANPQGSTILSVTASTNSTPAGTPFSITVTAENSSGQVLTGYQGTVQFTTTDKGTGVVLPGSYTFTAADNGTHTFTNGVTLVTAGNQTVTATDTSNGSITGQTSVTVTPLAATTLSVSAPANSAQGVPFTVTVTALDKYGNTATGYQGTVQFTTTDNGTGVVLPGSYTFTAADNGVHTFTNGVTLVTPGTQTVTATDNSTASITGTASVNVTVPQAATHLGVTIPANTTAGTPFSMTITALASNGATATSYRGTIFFTTTDKGTGVVLPGSYTFTAADNGVHTFTNAVTLVTAGSQTITATDKNTSTITGHATTNVAAAAATHFVVTGFPSPINAGTSGTFTVTADDAYGNTATGYTGIVSFSSSDPAAFLPPNSSLQNGKGTFSATLNTPGMQSLTATDTVKSSIKGTQAGIVVNSTFGSAPTVTGLSPTSGSTAGGYRVTISGTNFVNGATTVYFGPMLATVLNTTPTTINVMAPMAVGPGVVNVVVTTQNGTSQNTPADQFTYTSGTNSTAPQVLGLTPSSGSTVGGYKVTISGVNLGGAMAVYFGPMQATILSDSPTSITVMAPPAFGPTTVNVVVMTSNGTSQIGPADQFTYVTTSFSGHLTASRHAVVDALMASGDPLGWRRGMGGN